MPLDPHQAADDQVPLDDEADVEVLRRVAEPRVTGPVAMLLSDS